MFSKLNKDKNFDIFWMIGKFCFIVISGILEKLKIYLDK
jgi:hypothetical protein